MNHKDSISSWAFLCTVALVALAVACGGTEHEVTPTAEVAQGPPASGNVGGQAISVVNIPNRHLFDLARRLSGLSPADLKRTVGQSARPYRESAVANFWVVYLDSVTAHTITATVKLVS